MTTERFTAADMQLEILYNQEKWSEIYNYVKKTMDKPKNERKHILKQWEGTSLLQRIFENTPDINPYLTMFPIDIPDRHGRTTLWHAVSFRNIRTIQILLEAGADPNIADVTGATPVFHARDGKTIDLLVRYGADLNVKDTAGHTPLEFMMTNCYRCRFAALQYLQKKNNLRLFVDPLLDYKHPVTDAEYYQKFCDIYAKLYDIYDICNKICWAGTLPHHCIFGLKKLRNIRLAEAEREVLCYNGDIYHKITFNKSALGFGIDSLEKVITILLHEMVHIWQFSRSFRAKFKIHDKNFKGEMKRIGNIEKEETIESGSLAEKALREIEKKYPTLYQDLYDLAETKIKRPSNGDVCFFAEKILGFMPGAR